MNRTEPRSERVYSLTCNEVISVRVVQTPKQQSITAVAPCGTAAERRTTAVQRCASILSFSYSVVVYEELEESFMLLDGARAFEHGPFRLKFQLSNSLTNPHSL